MIIIRFGEINLVNGTELASFIESHVPDFTGQKYFELLEPRVSSEDSVNLFGYEFNIKSTIYREINPSTLISMLLNFKQNFENVFRAFLNFEIYTYAQHVKGRDIFLFPSLDIIKFAFWSSQGTSIPILNNRIKNIRNHILNKANLVLSDQQIVSVSTDSESLSNNFLDLLNSTSDFCNEIMFAYLCHFYGYNVSIAGNHDFMINNKVSAEIKTIHDKLNKSQVALMSNLNTKILT